MDVRFYATLRQITGTKVVTFDLPADTTVRALLEAATEQFPKLGPLIWTADGALGDYLKVFVDGREIRHLALLEPPLAAGSAVDIFPPVAGG